VRRGVAAAGDAAALLLVHVAGHARRRRQRVCGVREKNGGRWAVERAVRRCCDGRAAWPVREAGAGNVADG
jgi:hypothetical protein